MDQQINKSTNQQINKQIIIMKLNTLFNQIKKITGKRTMLILSFLIVFMLALTSDLNAQAYTVSWSGVNAGNPGGLNTDYDNNSSWPSITSGSQSSNFWSGPHDIPFDFEFYGVNVTQFMVSQNGLITFDISASGTPKNNNTNLSYLQIDYIYHKYQNYKIL